MFAALAPSASGTASPYASPKRVFAEWGVEVAVAAYLSKGTAHAR
jgi:hypothetical protein